MVWLWFRFGFRSAVLLILFLTLLTIVRNQTDYQLRLVQIVFRHGARASGRTFPTDKWQENAWPDGLGHLTNVGIDQQYRLGQYLRTRYISFINDSNVLNTVRIQSTDVDRALMSAYANLAGFFPPNGRSIWNKDINWRPIPVHTMPSKDDYLISYVSPCPNYDELYENELNSDEANEINENLKDFYRFLTNKTEREINNFNQASNIYKIFIAEQTHNMPLPDWANETVLNTLKKCEILFLTWKWKTRELCRLRGGPLVGEIRKNILKVVNETEKRLLFMYSAHDSTIVSLLSALEIYQPHVPPYCSTVMIELLENKKKFYIKILYRNDTTREPYEMSLKDCSSPCPLEDFKMIIHSIIPNDIQQECFDHVESFPFKTAIVSCLLGFLGLLLIVLGCYWFGRRRKNEK